MSTETSMVTLSGRLFDYLLPDPEVIDVEEMAWVLAGVPRFQAQLRDSYNVAQHSCLVHDLVRRKFRPHALFHDGHEIVTGDINRPLKKLLGSPLLVIEQRTDAVIFKKLGILVTPESVRAVKEADDTVQAAEFRTFVPKGEMWARAYGLPMPAKTLCIPDVWSRERAAAEFMARYQQLKG